MKQRLGVLLMWICLLGPQLAWAGEKDVKAQFLLVGGIGGLFIGAGFYAFALGWAAVATRHWSKRAAVAALALGIFGYIQYWSCYFLTVALRFLSTRQMRYEFGELPPLLPWLLTGLAVWVVLVPVVALRVWRRAGASSLPRRP